MSTLAEESKALEYPLADLRVVEMGQLIAGPFCGQLLGDFGAEVIKVEEPRSGDPMRVWGAERPYELPLWWPLIARNKKSVTCNLRTRRGQELARQLVARADVLIENFRPGTLENWGLDYATLSGDNPGLVLVRVTGYGQTGPYATRAGFGSIGEAMGGIRYVTGDPDRPPSRVGVSLGDSLSGVFAALGTFVALHARKRTGRGQVVDVAIYEAVLALMESLVAEWGVAGYQRERTGAMMGNVAPSNVYPTADAADVLIGANRDTVFSRLCAVMGNPGLADDDRFASHVARGRHQQELDELIARWTRGQKSEELLELLHEAGVPAGRIYKAADMLADEHFAAREAIVRVAHAAFGDLPMQNVFPRLSDTPGHIRWSGPELGEHNGEVYGQLLGLGGDELAGLQREGVI
jgi:formyl-CoA transferase